MLQRATRALVLAAVLFPVVTPVLGPAGCQVYENQPPRGPCAGCPPGERCCEDEATCWPEGQACPCQGVVCQSPPAPVCLDETTLRVFEDQGSCGLGLCTYPFEDFACEVGPCLDGACAGGCLGGGLCLSDADCDDGNPCTVESCQAACCRSQALPEGLACDDGDDCTAGDVCQNGMCAGLPVPGCPP